MTSVVTSPVEQWTATASGLWSVAANWSLGRAPKNGDDVEIAPSLPLVVTDDGAPLTLAALTLSGATLDLLGAGGSAQLTVAGAATLASATIEGSWPLTLDGASAIEGLTLGGAVHLFNRGTVTQSGGAVTLASAGAYIYNAVGATWIVPDTSGLTGPATGWGFYNLGTFQKTSGSGVALIKANFRSTGTLASQGGGDIEFDGAQTLLSGTYIGAGMVDYGPDGVATIGDVDVTASSCQTNWGTVDLVGTMTMNDGSTIMNASGARWNFDGDSSLVLAAGQAAGPDINGMGTIAKTHGTGTSHIGVVVTAEGLVNVETGTLSFEGATSTFSSTIAGAGTFEIGAGAATLQSGARVAAAGWTLAGGVTTLGESVNYAGAFTGDAGAGLALGGKTLTTSGATTLAGLTLGGTGVLHLTSATSVTGLTIGGADWVEASAKVTQGAGDSVTLGDASSTDAARLAIAAGGAWLLNGGGIGLGADPASQITIAASATNPGLLAMTGSGTSTVLPKVLNNAADAGATLGGLEVSSGTLDLKGEVLGTGADNIVGAGTLEFDDYVQSGQTVLFSGAGGTLSLQDLGDFHGAISGFDTVGSNDALLIGDGWSYVNATITTSAATLYFADGPLHKSITLQGDYVGGAFTPTPVNGQVQITY